MYFFIFSCRFDQNYLQMTKERLGMALSVLLIAVVLTYSNHFHNSLHFDDAHTIGNNAYIQNIKNIPLFFKDGATSSSLPSNQSYRPFLTTTLAIDYWLGHGLNDTFFFHLTSFLFFILQGLLMFFLFRFILKKSSTDPLTDYVAWFATIWYMLHPVCAETINYVIQRGDSLSTFFVVLGLALYALSPLSKKYYLYLIPVLLGILTKPSALIFAPILFCYIVLFEKNAGFITLWGNKKKSLTGAVTGSAMAFAVCIAGYLFVARMQPSTYVSGATSPMMYRLTQPFIMFSYFTSWFAPVHLNADTDWLAFTSVLDPYAILGYVFLAVTIYLIFICSEYQTARPIAFGLAWFLLANIPTTVISFSEITNDHRMFFPYVGLALAVVWALYLLLRLVYEHVKLPESALYVFFSLSAFMLCAYAYGTYQRNEVWHTDESLWKDCAEKSPKNARGLMNYGLALMAKGDYSGAEKYFSDGLLYWPYYSYLHVNMAILKSAQGKKEEAEKYFRSGLQYGAAYPNSYFYYARFLNDNGRKEEAAALLVKALQMASNHLDCRYLLMDILYSQGKLNDLKRYADETAQIAPNDVRAMQYVQLAAGKSQLEASKVTAEASKTPEDFLNLSLQYYNAGNYQGCIDAANKALALRPDYAPAFNNIGSAYNVMKKYKEAKEAMLRALATDPNNQLYKNNLAVAVNGLKAQNK